jgi:hypothetical protein
MKQVLKRFGSNIIFSEVLEEKTFVHMFMNVSYKTKFYTSSLIRFLKAGVINKVFIYVITWMKNAALKLLNSV